MLKYIIVTICFFTVVGWAIEQELKTNDCHEHGGLYVKNKCINYQEIPYE